MDTDKVTVAPLGAADVALQILQQLNQVNARLVRVETRQARQMLDSGMTLNAPKEDRDAATTTL